MATKSDKSATQGWRALYKYYAQTPSQGFFLVGSALALIMLIPIIMQSRTIA